MPLEIVHGDITKMQVDAIVNAANCHLRRGDGVCGAIFSAAGERQLQSECSRIGFCAGGSAVITGGYVLPAKYIVHTVGPVWRGGKFGEETLLRSCYRSSLELAKSHGLESIAFPLISAGVFGYPRAQALMAAESVISEFLAENEMKVFIVLFDGR